VGEAFGGLKSKKTLENLKATCPEKGYPHFEEQLRKKRSGGGVIKRLAQVRTTRLSIGLLGDKKTTGVPARK